MFKQNKLSTAIVAVLATVGASQAMAQDAPAVEEVVVTGMRASVQAAMDIKRDAAGVVDAISAEDIGKFPDTNLAESLQRITGVSIDRTNGEGSRVTVRGFGPDNNMVTLNGRNMPGGSTYAGSSGADGASRGGSSRAFDFANLASEAVAGVEVYKTGKAAISTGGIGATIDIKTTRPLDNPGLKGSVGVKGVMDTTNRTGSDMTPELSGLISWSDDSDKFGVSLSASLQERDSGYTGATVNGWNIGTWGEDDLYTLGDDYMDNELFINPPKEGEMYARPNDIRYAFSDSSRTRTNAQLTLQFAPTDAITTTLDYTFAENELEEQRGEVTNWVQNGGFLTAVEFDNSTIRTPILITEDYRGRTDANPDAEGWKDIGFSQQFRSQTNTLDSLGFNLEWEITDQFALAFDIHDSTMESMPTGPGRSGELDVGIGAPIKQGKTLRWGSSGVPSWTYVVPDADYDNDYALDDCAHADANPGKEFVTNCNQILDQGDLSSTVLRVWSAEQVTDVTQFKLDGVWEFDDGRFDFGVESRAMSSNTTTYNGNNNQVLGGWGADNPGEFPEGMIESFNITGEFDDYNTGTTPAMGFRADARELADYLVNSPQYAALLPYIGVENTDVVSDEGVVTLRNGSSSSTIEEDTAAAYFQVALEGEIGGLPYNLLTGIRYEHTDLTSTAGVPPVSHLQWQSDNDFSVVSVPGATATIVENSYDNLLPSLDFDISFTDDVKGRFSFGQTIARPPLGNLNAAITGVGLDGSTMNSAVPNATGADPTLEPLQSTNFDISVEWYFAESSYVSAGLWEKRVQNFVGLEQLDTPLGTEESNIQDQTAGPRAQLAKAELEARGFTADNNNLFTMMVILDNPDNYPNGADDYDNTPAQAQLLGENCVTTATPGITCNIVPIANDPDMVFQVELPVNKDAKIHGMELAVQHFFGDTGIGVMANYTFVGGDINYSDESDPTVPQFALLGLSDTANLVLMYENHGVQARLAYNWRDEYLGRTNAGNSINPGYTEAYSQLDLNVSYEWDMGIAVFFEGINITGEDRREHGRNDTMLWGLEDLGARYQLGARYSF